MNDSANICSPSTFDHVMSVIAVLVGWAIVLWCLWPYRKGPVTTPMQPAPVSEKATQDAVLGRDARMRAAGLAGLLSEVMGQNARRELDEDLVDRIEMALADSDAVLARSDTTNV